MIWGKLAYEQFVDMYVTIKPIEMQIQHVV